MGLNRSVADRAANTLVSKAAQDGRESWWSDGSQEAIDSHYDGFIPQADVENKLLSWEPLTAPVQATVQVDDMELATGMDSDGNPIRTINIDNKLAIIRSDTMEVIGVNGDKFVIHDYSNLVNDTVNHLTGETLGIVSAGLLRNGGQMWLQVAHEMTTRDDMTGIDFKSYIGVHSSLDGSIATQFGIETVLAVCENTVRLARGSATNTFKRKHTVNSSFTISDVSEAMGLIERKDEAFVSELHYLAEMEVTDKQLELFLDQWAPLPDENGRGRTRAENKRDKFLDLYRNNDMCSDWQGTGFGVLQTANTFEHYLSEIRGGDRAQRIREQILSGKMGEKDMSAHKMLLVATA